MNLEEKSLTVQQIINAVPSLIFITPQKVDFFPCQFQPKFIPLVKAKSWKLNDLNDQKQKCLAARKKNFLNRRIRDVKCHTIRQYTKTLACKFEV